MNKKKLYPLKKTNKEKNIKKIIKNLMDIVRAFQNNNLGVNITVIGTYDNPLFKAADIALILELKNVRVSISDFSDKEKMLCLTDTSGGKQKVTFLTELGLYKLLYRSRKQMANKFQEWSCEIIKEIRLKGKYELEKQIVELKKEHEQNLLKNFSKKTVVYVGFAENNILKFGWTDDLETRLMNHKKDYNENFTFKYIYESLYSRKIEKEIKQHPIINKKLIKKIYNKKNRIELIQLDLDFTIEAVDKIIREIKEKIECDKDETINKLELENKKLKEILENKKLINILEKKEEKKEENEEENKEENEEENKDVDKITKEIKNKVESIELDSDKDAIINKLKLEIVPLKEENKEQKEKIEELKEKICGRHLITKPPEKENLISDDIIEKYIEENIEYSNKYKVANIQIHEHFNKWYLDNYNINLDLQNIKDTKFKIKKQIIEKIMQITGLKESKVNINDKIKNIELSKYNGFVGIRCKQEKTYMNPINIYIEFINTKLQLTNNKQDKLTKRDICEEFIKWNKYEINTNCIGNSRFSIAFMNEIKDVIKEYTKCEYDDKMISKKRSGCFIGMKFLV